MPKGGVGPLALGALGVVYGDIGTSPLYAMDQIFRVAPARTPEDALGAVSLVVWTLTLIVAIKYSLLVLRAQNDGEGGVFALYGLLHDRRDRRVRMLLWALMVGAGLLIGDGMITPAISVLSAVEGLGVAAPDLASAVIPVTLGLLIAPLRRPVQGRFGRGLGFRTDRASSGSPPSRRSGRPRSPRRRRSSPPSIRSTASSSWAGRISPARSCCSAP